MILKPVNPEMKETQALEPNEIVNPDNDENDMDEVVLERLATLTTAPPHDWTHNIRRQALPQIFNNH